MKYGLYTRLYLWLVTHRRRLLGLTMIIAAVSAIISSRVRLDEDILATLPRNDQLVDEYRYVLKKFRQIDRAYIDIGVNTDDPNKLGRAADEFYYGLATNTDYARIMYRFDMGGSARIVDYLTGALPNLFTDADAKILEKKIEPGEVRDFLTVMRRKLAGPEGMVLKDVVAADPIGSSSLVVSKVLPLQAGFGDAQIVDGRITSGDGRHVLVIAEPKFPSGDSAHSVGIVSNLLAIAHNVERQNPGVHVAITGGHRMTVDNTTLIKHDARKCVILSTVAMVALCLTAFRRRWLSLVTLLPSFFGMLLAGVVIALWQDHLTAVAMGFATIAIGITVDYAIYVIYHLDNAAGLDHPAVGRHVAQLVLPISVGALTTIAAFAVMAKSPIPGYQQLGILGAVGVLFSAAFALIILPLLVPIPKQTGQPPLWLTRLMEKFSVWHAKRMAWLLAAVAILTIVTACGVKRLRFEGDIAKLNGITEDTRRDDEIIRNTWGDALSMTLVVAHGPTVEAALAQNDVIAGELVHEPGVTAVSSLASVCPSKATQQTNIQRWHAFWTPARQTALRQTLQQVGRELGFRADAFDRFWKGVQGEPALVTLDTFRGSPLEQAFSERVAIGTNDVAVSTSLKLSADHAQVKKMREALPGAIVINHKDFVEHIASLAKSGLGKAAFWTSIIVTFIVYLSLASVELVVAVLLPLAFGLLWTFGLMGWLGLPINMINSLFVIFIIGVGEDYSLFLATSKLDEWRGRPTRIGATSASVLISALTTMIGFAALVFGKHPILFSMGTTVLIGMGFSFAATLILTPFFMSVLLFKDQPRGAPRWWHLLGTLWVTVHLGGSELILYYILRPILHLISPRTAADRLRRATRWAASGVVKGLPFGKLEFQNITRETFQPPCIVISNHQSAVDVMLVVSLPADVRQTAKKRVFDTPILGIGCKLLGHIMVEQNDPEITLRRCREKLAEGCCVHFYPEGTRSHDGYLQRFHRGAFELAIETKQDILPVILCDTNTAMPRDSYWFEPYHVVVKALPRITPANFDYSQGVVPLMRHCETVVRAALQEQLDQLNTPRVVRRKVNRLYRYQGKFAEQFVYWKMKLDPVFLQLDAVVPRNGFILDLGCGYGVATHWLACFTDERTFLAVDYDEDKIRVAKRTAPNHKRIQFTTGDILNYDYPPCDAVLLLDVLHYWTPDKQQLILNRTRQALRPGGTLILREAARADGAPHERVVFWERLATRIGHNKTEEGLHFQTLAELEAALKRAGFIEVKIRRDAGNDSNILLLAKVAPR